MFTRADSLKIFLLNIKAHPVNTGDYMACKEHISFATDLAAILVAIDSKSRLTSIPSFCALPSEVAVLFNLNLSRRPLLTQVVDLDLLLCTGLASEHEVLFLCHISTQRPITDRKIERSYGRCFARQQLLANSIQNFISHEKKNASSSPKFTKHQNLVDS